MLQVNWAYLNRRGTKYDDVKNNLHWKKPTFCASLRLARLTTSRSSSFRFKNLSPLSPSISSSNKGWNISQNFDLNRPQKIDTWRLIISCLFNVSTVQFLRLTCICLHLFMKAHHKVYVRGRGVGNEGKVYFTSWSRHSLIISIF